MLIVLINKATKLSDYFLTLDKEYIASIKLGTITDTRDTTGKVLETRNVNKINEKKVKRILGGFTGKQMQMPPVYSALKFKGKPLYKIARAGMEVKIKKRAINISTIEFISLEESCLVIKAICSRGTYIRSLAHDIGLALGTGATLQKLDRTRIGNFLLKDCVDVGAIIKDGQAGKSFIKQSYIIPAEKALKGSYDIYIYDEYKELVHNGHQITGKMINIRRMPSRTVFKKGDHLAVRDIEDKLLAIHRVIPEEVKLPEINREDKYNLSKSIVIF